MLAFLVTVRDVLIAMALAWVGVTLEQRSVDQSACRADTCQTNDR
ncbi:hypothetical protein [Candidatus Viadribacter manganicus]|nr:hypothetical protein [Candidatus Viadribacter manganicus]